MDEMDFKWSEADSVIYSDQRDHTINLSKVLQAKSKGLTRLEISICQKALEGFSPWNPSVKTDWYKKVHAAL